MRLAHFPLSPRLRELCVPALCAMTLGASTLCVSVTLSGCAAFTQQRPASEQESALRVTGVQDIAVAGAHALSRQGVTVIDVREPHEYQEGHVPGARNLPLGSLDTWASDLDPDGAYVLICRSGKRSARAMQGLEAKGFKNLRNVTGGMLSWEEEGLPVER